MPSDLALHRDLILDCILDPILDVIFIRDWILDPILDVIFIRDCIFGTEVKAGTRENRVGNEVKMRSKIGGGETLQGNQKS